MATLFPSHTPSRPIISRTQAHANRGGSERFRDALAANQGMVLQYLRIGREILARQGAEGLLTRRGAPFTP